MHPRHPKTGMAILEAIFKRQSSEEQLLAKLGEGDAAAAAQLYRLHVRYLTAVCSRYVVNDEDVKDVLQEAFIKIFSSIHRFQPKGTGSLRSWMSRIVANEAIDHLKAKSHLAFSELTEDSTGLPDEEPEVEGVPAEQLQRFVQELPEGYRVVFNLYVMEGKSHREIAAMLGIREGTSASQLHKAKCALAEKIKKYRRDNQA